MSQDCRTKRGVWPRGLGKAFQAVGTASAKAQGQDQVWHLKNQLLVVAGAE